MNPTPAPAAPENAEWQAFANIALDVAREAGALVLSGFRSQFQVGTKAHAELYTEFDVKSEQLIRERLSLLTPGIALVGEEAGGSASDELTWYVDPIDGTVNFAAGQPWFAVSIGLKHGTRSLAGAVVAPALGIEWWAWAGGHALRNGEPCRVGATQSLCDALVTTGFPCRNRMAPEELLQSDAYPNVVRAAREMRRGGSAAIELCLVADGTYDAYWMRNLPYWDTAAGQVILEAAGGIFRTLPSPTPQDVAGNESIVQQLLPLIT